MADPARRLRTSVDGRGIRLFPDGVKIEFKLIENRRLGDGIRCFGTKFAEAPKDDVARFANEEGLLMA